MNDPNDNHHTAKGYKELDILYGSDVKNNHNLEFRYTEPKKLQEIEKFFIEFFLSIRTFCDIFYDVNRELKYFNYKIVKAINDIPDIHPGSVDNLLSKIKAKLYELNLNIITNGANQVVNTKSPKHNLNNEGNISRLFLISQEEILNDLFQPSHPRHISPSSSKSEGEFIKTKGLGFKKGVDGWLIRTESINTNNEYKTLSLSKVEHIPDIKDTSIDLPLRVSVINQNESDSEILFKKKITPVFEKQYETLDDIVNELEKSNRQDRNNRGSERLVNLSGFTPNKLSNLNIGNSNKPISPVILVSNTNYQPLNMKLHYKKRTGTVQLTNNTLGQKLVLLESKVSPLINNDDNIRVSSAKMLKFEELKVASSKKLIEKDDIPQFHND